MGKGRGGGGAGRREMPGGIGRGEGMGRIGKGGRGDAAHRSPGTQLDSDLQSRWCPLESFGEGLRERDRLLRRVARCDAVADAAAAPEDEDATEGSGLASPKPAPAASGTRNWSTARPPESETSLRSSLEGTFKPAIFDRAVSRFGE